MSSIHSYLIMAIEEVKIEKLKVVLGIIWLEWITSTTSLYHWVILKKKKFFIYLITENIYFSYDKLSFFFFFSLKNVHKCTHGIFSKKKKKSVHMV